MSNRIAAGRLYIGTSGWSYKHWMGIFYPTDMAFKNWLEFYARHFSTVEINNSFYRLPSKKTFESWRERTPDGFVLAVKASRYITHLKKLKEADDAWKKFATNISGLGKKLGPILFQFPANWQADIKRLADFLSLLPEDCRYAFEFRHESWFNAEVYALLSDKNAALCIADSPTWPTSYEITASYVFIRMHGGQVLYASEYSEEELARWANLIKKHLAKRLDVFVYFNNDAFGYAVKNAMQLKDLLEPVL